MRSSRFGRFAGLMLGLTLGPATAFAQQRSLPPRIPSDTGVVQVGGRKVSLEQKAVLDERARREAAQLDWLRQIQALRPNLDAAKDEDRRAAEDLLASIRDPLAVPALVRVLGRDNAACRLLLARTLDQVPGPEARDALLASLLMEDDPAVRAALTQTLAPRQDGEVHGRLSRLVQGSDPIAIGRAARALADLEVRAAVPALVPALVKVQQRPMMIPASSAPTPGVIPGIASGTGPTLGVVTGPVVGPGVVAYGATGVPLYPTPSMFNVPSRRAPSVQFVKTVQRRPEVLEALVRLTGQDFGYDQEAWRNWMRLAFRAEPEPARRVPQP
jgi:hypothetical protein